MYNFIALILLSIFTTTETYLEYHFSDLEWKYFLIDEQFKLTPKFNKMVLSVNPNNLHTDVYVDGIKKRFVYNEDKTMLFKIVSLTFESGTSSLTFDFDEIEKKSTKVKKVIFCRNDNCVYLKNFKVEIKSKENKNTYSSQEVKI